MMLFQHLAIWLALSAYLMDGTNFFFFVYFLLVIYVYMYLITYSRRSFFSPINRYSNTELIYFRL